MYFSGRSKVTTVTNSAIKKHRILACDGLRAIALLGVTAFHVWPNRVPGGFFAVNIFFVLAGFFVSQKLYYNLVAYGQSKHELGQFYQKRIERLYLPLIPLLIAVNLWTYFFQPNVYRSVRQSTPSVFLFFNNIYQLLGNNSYFATHGNFQPFRHMWTLALEMQFYLLYPLLVALLWRISKKQWCKISKTLLGLSVLSAILMAVRYNTGVDPTPIYYSFTCRLFAFTLGGAAAFYYLPLSAAEPFETKMPRHIRNLLAIGCLITVITAFFTLDYQQAFVYRGGMFLYSLIISLCIILLYPEDTGVAGLLSVPGLRFLSERSYSYYIWQYPLQVLDNSWFAFSTTPIVLRRLLHFALLLIIGEISYRLFEQHVITSPKHRHHPLITTGLLMLVCMYFSLQPATAQPSTPNLPPPELNKDVVDGETRVDLEQLRLLAIGDSVLEMTADQLKCYLPKCTVDAKISRQIWHGIDVLEKSLNEEGSYDAVLISLGTNGDFKESILDQYYLLAEGRPIIFLTTVMPDSWEQSVNSKFRRYAATHSRVYVADWYTLAKSHREWFYEDGTHPKPEGVERLVELILGQLNKLAATPNTNPTEIPTPA